MRHFLFAAALALVPAHIVAQELDKRYTQVGTFSGTVDSAAVELIGTFDHEREKSSVTIDDRSGFPMILVQTRSIDADGTLTMPGVGILIGPLMAGASTNADVTSFGADGMYNASPDFDGRLAVQDLEYSEENLSFSLSGELVPVIRGNSGFERDPDRTPIDISGSFSGTPTYKK